VGLEKFASTLDIFLHYAKKYLYLFGLGIQKKLNFKKKLSKNMIIKYLNSWLSCKKVDFASFLFFFFAG